MTQEQKDRSISGLGYEYKSPKGPSSWVSDLGEQKDSNTVRFELPKKEYLGSEEMES
jgi:hypothetical protein